MSSYSYIREIFKAKTCENGGVVRRKVSDVKRMATVAALFEEVRRRGFHLLEAGDQFIIVCRSDSCKLHF